MGGVSGGGELGRTDAVGGDGDLGRMDAVGGIGDLGRMDGIESVGEVESDGEVGGVGELVPIDELEWVLEDGPPPLEKPGSDGEVVPLPSIFGEIGRSGSATPKPNQSRRTGV